MATTLLIFTYIIYIGLGLPDSVLGSAWTSISAELSIPIGFQSFVSVLISLCTVTASFFSARIINKFGTGTVTAVSTLMTALALLSFSFANSIWTLCLCAVPLGAGAGAIDAALNNYVSVNYRSFFVNLLHCFYGIGVALSPYVFSFALKTHDWRSGYRTVFLVQLVITFFAFVSLIFWKKIKHERIENGTDFTPVTLNYKQMFKNSALRISWLVFFSTCALEFTCDYWGASFLEKAELATADVSARFLSLYFIGMTFGRFLSGLLSTKISNRAVIFTGYTVVLAGIIILVLPVNYVVKGFGLMLIGLGNGPTFPNLSFLSPKYFGVKYSQSVISSQMVLCNLGIMTAPALFGVIVQVLSIKIFPVFLAVLYAVMVLSTIVYFKRVDKGLKSGFTF